MAEPLLLFDLDSDGEVVLLSPGLCVGGGVGLRSKNGRIERIYVANFRAGLQFTVGYRLFTYHPSRRILCGGLFIPRLDHALSCLQEATWYMRKEQER